MKKNLNIFLIFVAFLSLLSACKKDNLGYFNWKKSKKNESQCQCNLKPILNSVDFDNHSSFALNNAYIKNDKLFVKGYFISTDKMYAPNYHLFLNEGSPINNIKIQLKAKLDIKNLTKNDGLYTDLRSFTQDYCYDISELKQKYKQLTNYLEIELVLTDGNSQTLTYNF